MYCNLGEVEQLCSSLETRDSESGTPFLEDSYGTSVEARGSIPRDRQSFQPQGHSPNAVVAVRAKAYLHLCRSQVATLSLPARSLVVCDAASDVVATHSQFNADPSESDISTVIPPETSSSQYWSYILEANLRLTDWILLSFLDSL